ncbi:hypothetical protein [Lysinibacter cavernae]|uniref:Uncharacterized protein n=1 Tax=Lysinibacter cavernae TaxID=1640652 RepID=A0A7X5R169_9MICO|nr:hypothetical protein [Lysinibacter cavernae]NIH53480.1 hypothetical protein [Lysinibacter cavernae]
MFAALSASPFVTAIVVAATETPAPEFDKDSVTPGAIGFAATAFVALMTVLLILDMNRRVRRTRYRAEVDAQLDAEEAAADGDAAANGGAAANGEAADDTSAHNDSSAAAANGSKSATPPHGESS